MNEDFTISELFYCLIQDIEDQYTMHGPHELDEIVEFLDETNAKELNNDLTPEDKSKLRLCESALRLKGYDQFAEDLCEINRRLK